VSQQSDERQTHQHSELGWPERIRQALAEDRFVFYYQSIKPLASGRPFDKRHFEVLTRFRDENGKLLPPATFMPAAERYGMMPAIDRWVVTNVLDALAHDSAPHSTLHTCAINLSGQSIAEDEFRAFVEGQFDKTGVDPKLICFEISEAAAIANLHKVTTFIAALRARGCRFALDDFGTGLASFAYLRSLPVDYLKIDGAFVKGMVDNKLDAAVVFSICHIGRVLGLKTIAEFVENDRIAVKLKEVGVDFVQGYGIEIPRPLNENSNLLAIESIAKALASR
jgi:EAL domain-containing protein (putative c-di-GMP-specific phosphodiesterase class I)